MLLSDFARSALEVHRVYGTVPAVPIPNVRIGVLQQKRIGVLQQEALVGLLFQQKALRLVGRAQHARASNQRPH